MNFPANSKSVFMLNSAAAATNADATAAVDTFGFEAARLSVYLSTSNAPTTLKVEGSDDATTYSTLNLTGGTDFTIATNNSSATTCSRCTGTSSPPPRTCPPRSSPARRRNTSPR